MKRIFTLLAYAPLLLAAACGDPPEPVGGGGRPQPDVPFTAASERVAPGSLFRASGTIELRGDAEPGPDASLYVSVGPEPAPGATRMMPWISKRFMLSDAERTDGGWRLAFDVDDTNRMMGTAPTPPGQLALKVAYSPSGDALDAAAAEIMPVASGDTVEALLELD